MAQIEGFPYHSILEDGTFLYRGRPVKQRITNKGYFAVRPQYKRKGKYFYIHRLVAKFFVENPNNAPIVNHIDNNRKNNHFSNLEWCGHSYNAKHSFLFRKKTNNRVGIKHREETKIKIKKNNPHRKQIINVVTNEIFLSINHASEKNGIPRTTLMRNLKKGIYKNLLYACTN